MAERRKQPGTVTELAARHTRARRATPKARSAKAAKTKRPRARRRQAGSSPFGRLLRAVGTVLVLMAVCGGLAVAVRALFGSEFFAVKNIELEGSSRTSREDLLALITSKTGGGVWQVNLEELREMLKRNPWVREAEVTRQLPDKLRVRISERAPFALVRCEDSSVVWVDRDGTVLGDQTRFNLEVVPPLISGLAEGASDKVRENRRRQMGLYQQLLGELDERTPRLATRVDEVIFAASDGLKLRVQDGRVEVLVGTQDFRQRTQDALRILAAVERKDLSALQVLKISDAERLLSGRPIAYINATIADRMIVGLAE